MAHTGSPYVYLGYELFFILNKNMLNFYIPINKKAVINDQLFYHFNVLLNTRGIDEIISYHIPTTMR